MLIVCESAIRRARANRCLVLNKNKNKKKKERKKKGGKNIKEKISIHGGKYNQ